MSGEKGDIVIMDMCGHPIIAVGARSADSAAIRAAFPGDSHHKRLIDTYFLGLDDSQTTTRQSQPQ
jgi:hypothetical protein